MTLEEILLNKPQSTKPVTDTGLEEILLGNNKSTMQANTAPAQTNVIYQPNGTPQVPDAARADAGLPQVPQQTAPDKPFSFSELPVIRKMPEGLNQAYNQMATGARQIVGNQSAAGVGNVAMGAMKGLGTTIPVLPAIDEATDALTSATGNREFAERAALVGTMGLPVKAGVKMAADAYIPSTRAITKLIDTIGPENLQAGLAKMKDDPSLTAADVFPGARSIAQGMAVTPGPHQQRMLNAIDARISNEKGLVTGAIDEATGVPVNIRDKMNDLKTSIRETGKKINPVLEATKPVDIAPVVQHIDDIVKPGLTKFTGQLMTTDIQKELATIRKSLTNDKAQVVDAKDLHKFQSGIRARAEDLINSPDGQIRQKGYALMGVRNKIVDAIDAQSPSSSGIQVKNENGRWIVYEKGQPIDFAQQQSIAEQYATNKGWTGNNNSYRAGLSKYRDENQIQEAFQKGQLVTRNKLGQLDDHPEYWKHWVENASPQELAAAREGARFAVDQQLRGMNRGVKKTEVIGDIEYNVDKLKMLFGEKEINTMLKKLQNQRNMAITNQKVFEGSQTSFRERGEAAIRPRPDYKPDITTALAPLAELATNAVAGIPALGGASVIGYNLARKGMTKIGQKVDRATNNKLADMVLSTGPTREELIKTLEQHIPQPKPSMLSRVKSATLPILPP